MARCKARRVCTVFTIIFTLSCAQKFSVPKVNIEVLQPRGIRVTMPDVPKMSFFAFNGNVNRPIEANDVGTIKGEVLRATNGKWVMEDHSVELKEGDIINYYVFVSVDRVGYIEDNQSFTVSNLNRHGEMSPDCPQSVSEIRGRIAPLCSGQTIFEDHFDTLRENIWQIEQYIPVDNPGDHNSLHGWISLYRSPDGTNPPKTSLAKIGLSIFKDFRFYEYPFVSYQRLPSNPTVSIVDGNLRIEPKLQANQPGFNNMSLLADSLNLIDGCTAPDCSKQASGADILPPVVSGRITSKGFAFKYGTIHVRAKLPQGDWLYPDILLESFLKKYGRHNYASGVMKIATARGNKELYTTKDSTVTDIGNKVLYSGPIMDFECRHQLLVSKELTNGRYWGDDFHEYSLRWSPDRIILSLDGSEWARIEPAASGLSGRLHSCTDLRRSLLASGNRMAPFDDLFYITLGVSAGGISEFPDGVKTKGDWPKPWRNRGRKAMLNFWQDVNSWYPTWTQPALLIDYVRVVAL